MRIDKRFRLLVLGIAVVSIFTLSVVFAVVSQTLTISTDVEVMPSSLNVEFEGDETESVAYNGAEVVSEGTIEGTSISGLSMKLTPGSYVETYFSVINNSENANVVLSSIIPKGEDENNNFLYDIKLVHYIDENTTKEVSLIDLQQLEYEYDRKEYLSNVFNADELMELGITYYPPEDPDHSSVEYNIPDINSMVINFFPGGSLYRVNASNEEKELIYNFNFETGTFNFNSDVPSILLGTNNTSDDYDRTEYYCMEISMNKDINLPAGYSIKFTNMQTEFTYAQVAGEIEP